MNNGETELRIGTSSWSSKDWSGVFYPKGLKPAEFIEYYAGKFSTVEIDATFYRMPTKRNVDSWRRRTPKGFVFAVKTPKVITHEKVLLNADEDMRVFLETIRGLEDRLGPVLLQFPYFNKRAFQSAGPFLERLDSFLVSLPNDVRFAVEVRNKQWIKSPLVSICRQHRVALAWVEQAWMPKAKEWFPLTGGPTADFAYLRWLGDHGAIEGITTSFEKTVIDRSNVTADWVDVMRELRRQQIAIYGYFNNHFAGHAPSSIDLFWQIWKNASG